MDERILDSIDKGVDITNEYLYDIRALLTEISDILKPAQSPQSPCICGGAPHASHCPLCPEPFLRGLL